MTENRATVLCRKCGLPIEGDGFGSPATGWEHPFSCPDPEGCTVTENQRQSH